jgi:hypothetical protein
MRFSDRAEAKAFVEDNSQVVYTVATNPYTMVQVQCTISGQVYDAVGFAKYNPNDALPIVTKKMERDPVKRALLNRRREKLKYDKQRGIDIAYGRAITEIVDALIKPVRVMGSAALNILQSEVEDPQ